MNQHSMNRGPDSYNNGSVCEVPPVRKCLKSRGGFPPSKDGFRTARSHGQVGRLFLPFCRFAPNRYRSTTTLDPSAPDVCASARKSASAQNSRLCRCAPNRYRVFPPPDMRLKQAARPMIGIATCILQQNLSPRSCTPPCPCPVPQADFSVGGRTHAQRNVE